MNPQQSKLRRGRTDAEVQRVIAVASSVAEMSDQQIRGRYHQLIDERPNLNALERFELERMAKGASGAY